MSRRLVVYLGDHIVGELRSEHDGRGGRFSFAYDPGWVSHPEAACLSLSLPFRGPETPYPPDAHAKNISFLHDGGGIRLAPFYDLLATGVYSGLSDKLAMKVGGEARPAWIQRRHWERLAEQAQIRPGFVLNTVRGLARTLPELVRAVAAEQEACWGPAPIRSKIAASVEASARRVLALLEP